MEDGKKTKKQLIEELHEMRQSVAELKGFEEEIEKTRINHEKFTKAFLQNSIPAGITTLKEGRFVEVSDAFLRLMGRRRDEVVGHTSVEIGFITEDQRSAFFEKLKNKGRVENLEMEVRTKGGALRYGLFNAVMMSLGNENYLLTVMTDITERKLAEKALIMNEKRFRLLSEAAFEAIAMHENGVLIHANDQCFKMFGYEPDEALGKEMMSVTVAPEALEDVIKYITGDSMGPYESVGVKKDGATFPMEIRSRKMEYEGRTVRVGAVRDITERKRAEDLYRTLANSAQSSISIVQEGRFCFVNPHASVFTGYETSELIGMDPLSLIHPDDRENTMRSALRMIKGKLSSPYGFRGIHKDGSVRWIMETVTPVVFDGRSAFLLNSMDITERKRAEAQLWENQERLRLALEAGKQGYNDLDLQNDNLYYSDQYLKILGYGRDELETRARSWEKLIHPRDKAEVLRMLKEHLDGRTDHCEATYRLKIRTGEWRWFRGHAEVVKRDDNGRPLRMMGTITDVSAYKKLEQELEKRVEERTAELVEVNAALKVLLKQGKQDKADAEEAMAANLKLLVLPYLHKLKTSGLNDKHKALVSLIDESLNKISSPFIKTLSSRYSVLTPKELQVAEHIRSGKRSKEIAEMMNLSTKTIDVFRYSLRKKLGLNNKKTNLQSLLSSL